ncbi:hypothetical protein [Lichenifustis flavocetrariae]|uniref:Transmembrane protein n=1 Tax=Lichenifustis flavocetrariae TaxID=2949735 RepID=A0AA42CIN2_9HYPH|nr:hypothetical protein [Lichenifustis flavocetrariae]MCW6508569.1 hypothetical protein [Lichenifustis flavocetrariae]
MFDSIYVAFTSQSSRRWMLMTALFIILSFTKMPEVMLHGRLWAEEGSVFMPDMASKSFLQALTYNYRGSVQLINAIACWFAIRSYVDLMPYVTTYAAFIVSGVLFMQLAYWAMGVANAPGFALFFLAGWFFLPESYEVWLTSTNIQWLCSLSVLMVLLLNEDIVRRRFGIACAWTLLCGLTGVPSCMLAPGFIAKGILSRSVVFASLGGLLALSTCVQLLAILTTEFSNRSYDLHSLAIVQSIIAGTIFQPIVGVKATSLVTTWVGMHYFSILICLLFSTLILFAWRQHVESRLRSQIFYVVGLWVLVTALNVVGSIPGASVLETAPLVGSRYFFFGASCLVISLLLLSTSNHVAIRAFSTLLLVIIAANGVGQRLLSSWPQRFLTGPSWAEQVHQCSSVRACVVEIWPATIPPSEIRLPPGNGTSQISLTLPDTFIGNVDRGR